MAIYMPCDSSLSVGIFSLIGPIHKATL
uniref:Uncharacterized protein n=1 Tax=Moniliophthora roreri TaxID=221103 RepID=A0A0W0EZ74_MONRR